MDPNKALEDENDPLETQNCHDTSDSFGFQKRSQNEAPQSNDHEVSQFKFSAGHLTEYINLFFKADTYYFHHYFYRRSRTMKIHLLTQQIYLTLSAYQLLCMALHTGTRQHRPMPSICGHLLHFVALLFPLISFMTQIKGGKIILP